jgi:hypothetical protein
MAKTREGRFIDTINRRLPKEIHHESCTSPFRSGTPDQYYEGDEGVCRIEYKFIHSQKLPARIELGNVIKKYALSDKQNHWLTRAFYNNVKVAVVLGTKFEIFMLATPAHWNAIWTRGDNVYIPDNKGLQRFTIVARDFVAKWIIENVT